MGSLQADSCQSFIFAKKLSRPQDSSAQFMYLSDKETWIFSAQQSKILMNLRLFTVFGDYSADCLRDLQN